MEITQFLKALDDIDLISNNEWMDSLEDRKLKELEFHNKDRDQNRIKESQANDTYEKFYGNKNGLTNIRYLQADAENTKLPSNSIDTIICNGMLHHLDLSYAFPELRRILKPGGKILAVEALDYNPIIKLYRMLTPDMRTEWEKAHILDLNDIKFASKFFNVDKVNYWHISEYVGAKIKILSPLLSKVDPLLEKIPLIKLMAWIFTFELSKN